MLQRVNQPPQLQRKERIISITPESTTGAILGTLTDSLILNDLQTEIINGGSSFLAIMYLLIQYLNGSTEIHTGIILDSEPGVVQKIQIEKVIHKIIKQSPEPISQAIQKLRKLYQDENSFYKLKPFGDMIYSAPAVNKEIRTEVEGVLLAN